MHTRIHDVLDGNLGRSELTAGERAELEELEGFLEESLALFREAEAPDLTPRVMGRIREMELEESAAREADTAPPSIVGVILRWVWAPRTVRVRPVWALVGMCALSLALGMWQQAGTDRIGSGSAVVSGSGERAVLYVRFELEAPDASSVTVAGTFSDWQPRYELAETTPGRWTALIPLRPGVHEYAFLVDGERWIADPHAPAVRDGFGGVNSRIGLVAPQRMRGGSS